MNHPHYKWFSYNLNIACEKCGDRIILQDPNEKLVCKSCSNHSSYTWPEVLYRVKLEDIKKTDTGSKNLVGEIDARSKFDSVDHISCYHCKSTLKITQETELTDYHCPDCNKPLAFENISEMHDFVFYSYKTNPAESSSPALVAVRCVSCGAPLEADPTKSDYHCKFCSTENVLPVSLRYKVVVNDIYIGIKRNFFPRELIVSKNPVEVLRALKQNGISSLKDEELNQIIKNHIAYTDVYFEILGQEYDVPKEIEQEVYNVCKHEHQIKVIGRRLGKSTDEINKKLVEVNPDYKPAATTNSKVIPGDKKQDPPKKEGFFKKLFG
jgi:DNA-directed RNA polymerase subunit RPC12/RpoP